MNFSNDDEISYFNNLLRGNCLTFNPGISKKLTGLDSRGKMFIVLRITKVTNARVHKSVMATFTMQFL